MPTILMILGWMFFFYANERNEPIHVHCPKGSAEAKYRLDIHGSKQSRPTPTNNRVNADEE
jgi:hypothetical protein